MHQYNLIAMSVPIVKFNTLDKPEFFLEVTKKVNNYFREKDLSKYANLNMKFKTVFMIALYFVPLILMLTGTVTSLWPIIGMWALMGLGKSGIGLSVMHDANHGSYSKNKNINKALGFLINLLGAYHINWKIQHNVLHHTSTNVNEYDEDITNPVMRFSPDQKRKKIFRFQAYYAPFFYGIMTIYWFLSKDFERLLRYKKQNLLERQGITYKEAVVKALINKIGYAILIIVLPLILIALPWWQIMLGFILMHFITGTILSLIFQPAHVLEETNFYEADDTGSVENNWAIHQMYTTCNYANGSTVFSWLVGGLNFQIEHHLFPNICHVHYKNISPIVEEVAKKFNIPYHQHKTFLGALISHFSLLNQLGTGSYDKKMAAA